MISGRDGLVPTLWAVECREPNGIVSWEIHETRKAAREQARYWRFIYPNTTIKSYKVHLVYEIYR